MYKDIKDTETRCTYPMKTVRAFEGVLRRC